jgi:uncharacterized protein
MCDHRIHCNIFIMATSAAPVPQSERIVIIDALRGFAILGILLMNIPGFAIPAPASHDPSVLNEFGTYNFSVWHFVEWFPEGTQRAIFSMLFGAGVLLFTSRQEKRIEGLRSADYFFRRQLWLMVFGLLDIYLLLWTGDILFDYACCGMILYTFRNLSPKGLLIAGGLCFLLMSAKENRDLYKDKQKIYRGEQVMALDTSTVKLNKQQLDELSSMKDFKERNSAERKVTRMERSRRNTTGNYENLYDWRTNNYLNNLITYSYFGIWDILMFMFFGMAFFKLGILTGQASNKVYWLIAIIGLSLGLLISYYRLRPAIENKFNWFEVTRQVKFETYTISRTLRALGIFGTIMLLYKSGWLKWLFALMRPVGQMAFTNYLTQSLICGLFFYGIGFGMYGRLQRIEIYYFVIAIWIMQILWSHIWLRYFYFGPMEWLWRSLTYWKKQPLRRKN